MLNPDLCAKITIAFLVVVLALCITLVVKQYKKESYIPVQTTPGAADRCLALNQAIVQKTGDASLRMVPSGRALPATYPATAGWSDCIIDPAAAKSTGDAAYSKISGALTGNNRCNETNPGLAKAFPLNKCL